MQPAHKSYLRTFTTCVKLLFILIVWVCFKPVHAQRNEVGLMMGGSFYMGDLNPHLPFAMTRPALGGLYRYNFNDRLSLRINGLFANIAADDAIIKYNEDRNLHFRSIILEGSVQGEVNFLSFEPGNPKTPHSPYLFAGGGLFWFNPQAMHEGQWYKLYPYTTEGQGSEQYPDRRVYKRLNYNILFGLGWKINLGQHMTAGLEWGMRRTGTDYLDDVSTTYPEQSALPAMGVIFSDRSLTNRGQNADFQRGNPNTNDWYSFAGIILTFRIKNYEKKSCPAYN